MKVELFPFQKRAQAELRRAAAFASADYRRGRGPQVISFTAPTGAGKTIIMASLIESVFFGDDTYPDLPEAVFVWLSDSPKLNEQSRMKIYLKSDIIRPQQCIAISEESFDQEVLEDGNIYFLNTQKLGKSGNLTKSGDRNYTIWETLKNTVEKKGGRLYFIIDEAHRGAQARDAGRNLTIMQKFLKGSPADGLPQMPVVIGMSATMERFNKLVEDITSTTSKCVVTPDEVRASGLLKDRIVITYPENSAVSKEMGVLEAAATDWKEKWDHWEQYCREQHHAQVNPVFVVQVQNVGENRISDTDLDDCLRKIEECTGFRFKEGEVVHSFGDPADLMINGLKVRYEEPWRISDDRKIKVVFFKESLSTGWDCPRAETMMSFRRAVDATYIAQLLGRMVRTPMQMRIQVDEVLNDVHLFLPHFDATTVKQVVENLQSEIPADVEAEPSGEGRYESLTVHPKKTRKKSSEKEIPGQVHFFVEHKEGQSQSQSQDIHPETTSEQKQETNLPAKSELKSEINFQSKSEIKSEIKSETKSEIVSKTEIWTAENSDSGTKQEFSEPKNEGHKESEKPAEPEKPEGTEKSEEPEKFEEEESPSTDLFDRTDVVNFINGIGLLSYDVRSVQINNYLSSMFKMAHFLCQSGLYPAAAEDVHRDIVEMIRDYVDRLKRQGKYDEMVLQVKKLELQSQIFDAFGKTVENYEPLSLFVTTDADIDRLFRIAESRLANDGVGNSYGKNFYDPDDPSAFMIDVILFVADLECMELLKVYAEKKFHELNDDYRRRVAAKNSEQLTRQFRNIVSDGDRISRHNFCLPETIQFPRDKNAKECSDHLFVNEETGTARIKLNSWEEGTLEEERKREDFVCWIRNPARGAWALTIPYQYDGAIKPTYPDLLIVRRDDSGYVIDILEPHMPKFDDNLGKAKGLAEYARTNPGAGRIQLIRQGKDATGRDRFKRLDMSRSETRERVLHAMSPDELNHIFDVYGFYA